MKKFNGLNILITGGAGFIGGAVIRRLLISGNSLIFNLDKIGYASDIYEINRISSDNNLCKRYKFLKVDLKDIKEVQKAIEISDPDLIIHLAAESHVDRSIDSPSEFILSNVLGTFNLLEASKKHWSKLSNKRKAKFKFLHISTDEVFGSLSLNSKGFDESYPYDPRSPYSASKASSDHLVRSWFHTYNFPILLTNCSNNFGPKQFPEKLIPLVIQKALKNKDIPLYGDGSNIRDWLFVEDHVDAILLVISKGVIGQSYCIGGFGEKSNIEVVMMICEILESLVPSKKVPYHNLIKKVKDRPGHDLRYSIDSSKIQSELGWTPKYTFESALTKTICWYLENFDWCEQILSQSGYELDRKGI
tara:strand:+ start:25636 stop:26718 length:1083 start_codon:yes stop_codon:yes gene_type:complete